MLFPVTIVDNFFEDPDSIVKYAKSLEYQDNAWYLPGVRTDALHKIDQELFNWITGKCLKLHYPQEEELSYEAEARFQKIPVNLKHDGWVHHDVPSELTCVIYLSKNSDTGTSFYKRKKPMRIMDKQKLKYEYFKNPNKNKKEITEIEKAKKFNNDFFEETINVKGLYNRCTLFDSSLYHAAHVFTGDKEEEDRLIFVNVIFSITNNGKMLKYPVTESFRF
jgi:hypothetical protein